MNYIYISEAKKVEYLLAQCSQLLRRRACLQCGSCGQDLDDSRECREVDSQNQQDDGLPF
jgi:hypothetical protein